MRFFTLLICVVILVSCKQKEKTNNAQLVDKTSTSQDKGFKNVMDLVIKEKNNFPVEFPDLYDSSAHMLPPDSSEKLILGNYLKSKGFKVINWGRGNFYPLGPRIFVLDFEKDDCICSVHKMYYNSPDSTCYEMRESISCEDTSVYYETERLAKQHITF